MTCIFCTVISYYFKLWLAKIIQLVKGRVGVQNQAGWHQNLQLLRQPVSFPQKGAQYLHPTRKMKRTVALDLNFSTGL